MNTGTRDKLKTALEMSIDLWTWLAADGTRDKEDWARFEEIRNMIGCCALCDIFDTLPADEVPCEDCPLQGDDRAGHISCANGDYHNWHTARNERKVFDAAMYARNILEMLQKAYDTRFPATVDQIASRAVTICNNVVTVAKGFKGKALAMVLDSEDIGILRLALSQVQDELTAKKERERQCLISDDFVQYLKGYKGKLALRLMHGREDPEEDMDDWGCEGPTLFMDWVHITYSTSIDIGHTGTSTGPMLRDPEPLFFYKDLLAVRENGKVMYYGDWEVVPAESVATITCAEHMVIDCLGNGKPAARQAKEANA